MSENKALLKKLEDTLLRELSNATGASRAGNGVRACVDGAARAEMHGFK